MVVAKELKVKLFFTTSNNTFYVQMGEHMLFRVRDTIVAAIQAKESIEIRRVRDIKEIQEISKSDDE